MADVFVKFWDGEGFCQWICVVIRSVRVLELDIAVGYMVPEVMSLYADVFPIRGFARLDGYIYGSFIIYVNRGEW